MLLEREWRGRGEGRGKRERKRGAQPLPLAPVACVCVFLTCGSLCVPVLGSHMTVLCVQPKRAHTVGRLCSQNTEYSQALLGNVGSSQGPLSPVQAEEGQCVG